MSYKINTFNATNYLLVTQPNKQMELKQRD